MAVNQPPISTDIVEASWTYEVTENVNRLEQRLLTLLQAIQDADTLEELKEQARDI